MGTRHCRRIRCAHKPAPRLRDHSSQLNERGGKLEFRCENRINDHLPGSVSPSPPRVLGGNRQHITAPPREGRSLGTGPSHRRSEADRESRPFSKKRDPCRDLGRPALPSSPLTGQSRGGGRVSTNNPLGSALPLTLPPPLGRRCRRRAIDPLMRPPTSIRV